MKKILFASVLLVLVSATLFYPSLAASGAMHGLRLCGNILIPSLFPYMVISAWAVGKNAFAALGKLLKLPLRFIFNMPPTSISPILIGWLCGYPAGIRAAAKEYEYGNLSKKEAERLMTFCACISPQFAIGVIGSSLFSRNYVGVCIYIGALISAIVTGVAIGLHSRLDKEKERVVKLGEVDISFTEAIADGTDGMIKICALTVFFAALLGVAEGSGMLKTVSFWLSARIPQLGDSFWRSIVKGFVELTSGVADGASVSGGFFICAMLAGFGGLCVITQCTALTRTKRGRLNILPMIASRLVQGVLTPVFASMLLRLDKSSASVFLFGVNSAFKIGVDNIPAAVIMLMTAAVVILKGIRDGVGGDGRVKR